MCVVVMFPTHGEAGLKGEVEGVWSGAAVTLLPVPMTELQFPPELLKESVRQTLSHYTHCLCDLFDALSVD